MVAEGAEPRARHPPARSVERPDRSVAERQTGAELRTSVESGAVAGQVLIDAESKLAQVRNALVVARSKWLALGLRTDSFDVLLERGTADPGLTLPVRAPVGGTIIHAQTHGGKGSRADRAPG